MNSKVFGPSTNIHKLLSGAALEVVKKRGLIEKEKQEDITQCSGHSPDNSRIDLGMFQIYTFGECGIYR